MALRKNIDDVSPLPIVVPLDKSNYILWKYIPWLVTQGGKKHSGGFDKVLLERVKR